MFGRVPSQLTTSSLVLYLMRKVAKSIIFTDTKAKRFQQNKEGIKGGFLLF